ncbi:hypothetical protein FACS189426_14950 [Bacteroidia bacterium]|nr:hypothetical protein FACS189426_14950 [Bacteroidia bacterium]GHV70894.1 hypothetical protein FACS189420_3870 [Bacteroidia bacterium]
MKKEIVILFVAVVFWGACSPKNKLTVKLSSEIVSSEYIGVGVEWDPYDEAAAWGASISEEDWQKLFRRLDFMRPGYIRCMINSPYRYYDSISGVYDKTRNIESISRLLQYCTDRKINVVYGEYNPPTWAMKADEKWVNMAVDYLNYLVNDLGFSCIKYFVIFNEPDGDWASTNGDYEFWKSMLLRFAEKMEQYPGLSEKVKFAGPDVVVNYKNPASPYNSVEWVKQTAAELDGYIGIYDIHAYPGQAEVRKGDYASILAKYKQQVPPGKKILLGEAGFKYDKPADSLLMKEYLRRVIDHPFTKGTDANMLVYDYFYGLDMALLCIETMNGGFSGIAAWMLDDAMHSKNDSGNTTDIKLWGMWNILGSEVFHDPSQEDVRPWYYTWSLLCRYFPSGAVIRRTIFDRTQGVYVAGSELNGKYTLAAVNVGDKDVELDLVFPAGLANVSLYAYEDNQRITDENGYPMPTDSKITIKDSFKIKLKRQSFQLLTNMDE